jgi:FO synthase
VKTLPSLDELETVRARRQAARILGFMVSATDVHAALEHARGGRGVSREDALSLVTSAELPSLLHAAASVRDRYRGRTVSYSKKVFIPLTHLCRDYCGYCTFRADPEAGRQPYMTPAEVLAAAEAGRRAGCKEALFSLGDQPERIFPEAREFLQKLGFATTLEYLAAMTELVLDQTGLLPHSNPGLMGAEDLRRLRESNVSMGLMLESSSPLHGRGAAHWRAPDKVPSRRLKTIEEAGRLSIAFTTGILIGIGETAEDRVDSLFAIRRAHEQFGHIQEVIVQPFRAKPGTPMAMAPDASIEDLQRTVAVARLVLGGDINLQSPPNLVAEQYPDLLSAGINDWGGISPVTCDFINPEAAWPQIPVLAGKSASAGFVLHERLAIYPEFIEQGRFVDARVQPHLERLRGEDGYARMEM